MTPRDVDALTHDELLAFWRYLEQSIREQDRELKRAQRRRG
jgi:hypothetical protein